MKSLLTRRFSPLWLVGFLSAFMLWRECGPTPQAAEWARGAVESCYAAGATAEDGSCSSAFGDVRVANELYGPLKSYRIASVSRGFSNRIYTVVVDAERTKGKTRETLSVSAFYVSRQEREAAFLNSLDVSATP